MTMVDKVARALAANAWRRGNSRDTNFYSMRYPGGEADYVSQQSHLYMDDARAAIEAMREPTAQMLTETHELVIGFGGDDGTYNIHCEDWQAKDVWMTMIDAALKEGK